MMHLVARALVSSAVSMPTIAAQAGYKSEAAPKMVAETPTFAASEFTSNAISGDGNRICRVLNASRPMGPATTAVDSLF